MECTCAIKTNYHTPQEHSSKERKILQTYQMKSYYFNDQWTLPQRMDITSLSSLSSLATLEYISRFCGVPRSNNEEVHMPIRSKKKKILKWRSVSSPCQSSWVGLLPPLRDGHSLTAVTSHKRNNFDCPIFPPRTQNPPGSTVMGKISSMWSITQLPGTTWNELNVNNLKRYSNLHIWPRTRGHTQPNDKPDNIQTYPGKCSIHTPSRSMHEGVRMTFSWMKYLKNTNNSHKLHQMFCRHELHKLDNLLTPWPTFCISDYLTTKWDALVCISCPQKENQGASMYIGSQGRIKRSTVLHRGWLPSVLSHTDGYHILYYCKLF